MMKMYVVGAVVSHGAARQGEDLGGGREGFGLSEETRPRPEFHRPPSTRSWGSISVAPAQPTLNVWDHRRLFMRVNTGKFRVEEIKITVDRFVSGEISQNS